MEILSDAFGLSFNTSGLMTTAGFELGAEVDDVDLRDECQKFIRFVCDYISSGHLIMPDETLGYGYWITKAVAEGNRKLCFWEYNPEAVEYIPGISNALRYWRDQHVVCATASSLFVPPNAQQMIVISDGVFEGDDVQGVRYPSPAHMSGWWITTDRYNADVSSLKTVHAFHLTACRPDLAKFLALANGHRFYSDNDEVRFDPKVIDGNS